MARFHPLNVVDVRKETRDAVVVTLEPRPEDDDAFRFVQGQYLTFRRSFEGEELRRSYSICSGLDDGALRVGIKRVDGGCFSTWANEDLMPGDVVLIFFVLVGLVMGWYLLPELKRNRASLVMFAVAIVLIGIAALQDAMDLEFMHDRAFRRFQTIAEELAEIWAQLLFALSFLSLFFDKLRGLLGRAETG